ncbi:MAG: AsmA-like C-terminal region, partial [Lacunisphaera sp.]|nr:AsmA-like C-terminal region [Lacunisphaera sp.]
ATYRRISAGKVDGLLDSLDFSHPPRVHAEGSLNGKWPGAVAEYTFRGAAEGGLHYYGFPLETAAVSGGVTGTDVKLDEIQFTTAGGKGVGKASLDGPADQRQLGFDVNVTGADLARTIRAFQEYEEKRPGGKKTAAAESEFMKRASGGRLDVSLSAHGAPGEIATFTGSGNAALTGIELAEIHLFGLLSQVLSGLSLNFSSLKLDAARTSFKLDGGRLHFPDLKISGPSAVIDARGDYVFASNALDFTAKFKPFEEKHTLLTIAMGIVVNPITSILELKLSGPLNKPDWSIVVGPSAPKPDSGPAPKPAETPAPGAPAKQTDPPKG